MKSPAVIVSTWPFSDGFPWDEELIRAGHRALSTHGRFEAPAPILPDEGEAISADTTEGQ